MLHGQLLDNLVVRVAVAAVLSAVAAAAPGTSRARADAAQVTVVSPGGSAQTLALTALAGSEDVVGRSYLLRSDAGESSQAITGFSLGAILTAAGADPFGFSYLEVQRPAGGSALLSHHQALDPGAFADGFPVIYATATGTGFLRPSASGADLNANDSFEAPQGVTLVLCKGSPLLVKAEASTESTRPGRPISFRASVDRAGSGEQLSYSWYFDDGHSATGASVKHSFAERGSYDVVVGVTTPGDRAGTSAVVTIQVGAPPSGGPDRKGGGRNRDAEAPDYGAATGTRGAAPPGPGSSTPAATAASKQPSHAHKRQEPHRQPAPHAEAGQRVSGVLLSGTATPAPTPTPSPAARTGALDGGGSGGGLPTAAVGLLVTAGLLGAGALVELRGGPAALLPGTTPARGGLR